MNSSARLGIDIIIPMYNEAPGLSELYQQLRLVTDELDYNFKFIFINDGSTDDTAQRLDVLAHHDNRVHAINLVRNFGKEIALTAGIHASTSDAAVLMDADLQHPPHYIPEFIAAWESGSPVVIATRTKSEKRTLFRSFSSKLFYGVINYASRVKISPDIMDFRLIDREVVQYFNSFKERNRITRGLIDWLGFPHVLIPVVIPERSHGSSTYSTKMLIRLAKDSLVSMSLLPLKLSGYLGLAMIVVFGLLGIAVLADQTFFGDNLRVSGAGSLGILTAFMIGVVLVSLGLVALYIANIHEQLLGRPLFVAHARSAKQLLHINTTVAPSEPPPVSFSNSLGQSTISHKPLEIPQVQQANVMNHHLESHAKQIIELHKTPQRILWLSWKDIGHPQSGGAEVSATELRERLVNEGYRVTLICGTFDGARNEETINGVRIIRMGNRYTVHAKVMWFYIRHRRELSPDICIEEINTAPFFFSRYTRRTPTVLFFHQLAREIWFYELPKSIGAIGYLLESWYIRALNRLPVITISRSTRLDLLKRGFAMNKISIISEGIHSIPLTNLKQAVKYDNPTVLSLGSVRAMKRTIDQLRAFELAKSGVPNLQMIIAGDTSGQYGTDLIRAVEQSEYCDDIQLLGRISESKKLELLRASHWLLVTSVKEGWGLVVSEAAAQGTPAIVYNVDGLRDSVKNGVTGYVVEPKPDAMAEAIIEVFTHADELESVQLQDENMLDSSNTSQSPNTPHVDYVDIQRNAWEFSKTITFENSYSDFKKSLGI